MTRITDRFALLKAEGRAGLVTFTMAGDPDGPTSLALLEALPRAGADVIELGMPFTDPMADGPAIQAAGLRALKSGTTLAGTLDIVRAFRNGDRATPLILMGYYNPIYIYGVARFLEDARGAGVDGLIVVDLPPEEDAELCLPARAAGLDFIRLATPTTDAARLPAVLANTSGFLYYVSIAGITGTAAPSRDAVAAAVARLKAKTALPVAVGFGVKTAGTAAAIAAAGADAVVVGSAIVDALRGSLDGAGKATPQSINAVTALVGELAGGIRHALTPENGLMAKRGIDARAASVTRAGAWRTARPTLICGSPPWLLPSGSDVAADVFLPFAATLPARVLAEAFEVQTTP